MPEDLTLATAPRPLPRGFRSCSKTPKDGTRCIVITASGTIDLLEFGSILSPDPALLHVRAFHRDGKPAAVIGWRPVPRKPISQRGEVFELGPHRLMCGDSTNKDDWQMLLGSEIGDAVITDPPYGINYSDPRSGDYRKGDHIENDDEESLPELLRESLGIMLERCKPGACWYVCGPSNGRQAIVFGSWMVENDILRQILVWNKDRFVFGRSDYHCKFETIFYGWKPGAAHHAPADRTQTSVWDCQRPSKSEEHPTMKPVELMERMINNSTLAKQIVLEPFGGSGTTLIAAARTGRVCRAMEIAPRYCDVIRRRWTKYARENSIDPGTGQLD